MHRASPVHAPVPTPSRPGRAPGAGIAGLCLGLAVAAAAPAAAQMPGVPLLQNGFVRPGAAVAANYATTETSDVFGIAGAWTPGSGRFQISAGVGALGIDGVDGRKTTGGLRAALPIRTPWTRDPASAVGLTGFLGFGGASLDEGTLVQVPLGVGIGYRRRLGAARAVAVFATPFFQWTRISGEGGGDDVDPELDSNLFRVALGAEAVLTRRLGVTLGYELGATADEGRPGPIGGIFGAGVSFAF